MKIQHDTKIYILYKEWGKVIYSALAVSVRKF